MVPSPAHPRRSLAGCDQEVARSFSVCITPLLHNRQIDQNDFPFTHQFIAMMLGVRRAGVTDALHILEGQGMLP